MIVETLHRLRTSFEAGRTRPLAWRRAQLALVEQMLEEREAEFAEALRLDLNKSRQKLGKVLVPTNFSQKWMSIEPAAARVARISPFVLPADGIAPVGVCEWLDSDTGDKLMLVYVDRPARIRGEIVYEGRNLRFDIESKEAGYLWIRQPDGSGEYRVAPWPGHVLLAVMPN